MSDDPKIADAIRLIAQAFSIAGAKFGTILPMVLRGQAAVARDTLDPSDYEALLAEQREAMAKGLMSANEAARTAALYRTDIGRGRISLIPWIDPRLVTSDRREMTDQGAISDPGASSAAAPDVPPATAAHKGPIPLRALCPPASDIGLRTPFRH